MQVVVFLVVGCMHLWSKQRPVTRFLAQSNTMVLSAQSISFSKPDCLSSLWAKTLCRALTLAASYVSQYLNGGFPQGALILRMYSVCINVPYLMLLFLFPPRRRFYCCFTWDMCACASKYEGPRQGTVYCTMYYKTIMLAIETYGWLKIQSLIISWWIAQF